MGDDEEAIRKVVDSWMDATRTGDIETVLDLMTDDVMFMTPGREPFGKAEFREQSAGLRGIEIDGRAEIRELQVTGDWAWVRNHIELSMRARDAEPRHRSGYTLTILRKDSDGRWRLFRDANLVS